MITLHAVLVIIMICICMQADGAGNTQFSLQCCFTKLSLPHANEDVKRNYFFSVYIYIYMYNQIKIDN